MYPLCSSGWSYQWIQRGLNNEVWKYLSTCCNIQTSMFVNSGICCIVSQSNWIPTAYGDWSTSFSPTYHAAWSANWLVCAWSRSSITACTALCVGCVSVSPSFKEDSFYFRGLLLHCFQCNNYLDLNAQSRPSSETWRSHGMNGVQNVGIFHGLQGGGDGRRSSH